MLQIAAHTTYYIQYYHMNIIMAEQWENWEYDADLSAYDDGADADAACSSIGDDDQRHPPQQGVCSQESRRVGNLSSLLAEEDDNRHLFSRSMFSSSRRRSSVDSQATVRVDNRRKHRASLSPDTENRLSETMTFSSRRRSSVDSQASLVGIFCGRRRRTHSEENTSNNRVWAGEKRPLSDPIIVEFEDETHAIKECVGSKNFISTDGHLDKLGNLLLERELRHHRRGQLPLEDMSPRCPRAACA